MISKKIFFKVVKFQGQKGKNPRIFIMHIYTLCPNSLFPLTKKKQTKTDGRVKNIK